MCLRFKLCPDSSSSGIMTSQQGSMFQNAETLLLEKKNLTKVIIIPDFNIFTASYRNLRLKF